jgi:hypothetical protein
VTLAVIITLAVYATPQPSFGKNLFVDFALFAQFHLLLEDVDFAAKIRGYFLPQFFFPADFLLHNRAVPSFTVMLVRTKLSFLIHLVRNYGKKFWPHSA